MTDTRFENVGGFDMLLGDEGRRSSEHYAINLFDVKCNVNLNLFLKLLAVFESAARFCL